jgi:poly-beta-1,6-N-acetyl-D-glucosamine synthase
MLEFLQEHLWGGVSIAVFFIAWLVQIFYLFNYFLKAGSAKPVNTPHKAKAVSVIICARNEEKNLMENVPIIMEQNHPNFELIIVNDSSWDDTEAVLKALHISYPSIRTVNLDEDKQNMRGKKIALTLGIKAAKNDVILLTDADCRPSSPEWISEMSQAMNDDVKMVIGFSPYVLYPGWLNKIIRFDTFMTALHYLGFANAGKPYMGVGRNLCYNRELFFKVGGFKSHYSIASGDDDLFVNQVATSRNSITLASPNTQTISEPKKSWTSWFDQKRRHFTTAPFYKASDKSRLAAWPLSFFMMLAAFIATFVFQTGILLVSGLLFLRYVTQITILHKVSGRIGLHKDLVWLAPILEIHLHTLNLGLYIINLVRKPQKWN